MTACDVLIVGAGIAGASMAYELQAWADVVLIERESRIGDHGAGRSSAIFAPSWGNRVIRALTLASRRAFEERLGGLVDRPVLVRRGAFVIARADQAERLAAIHDDLRPFAPALQSLQADEIPARVPELRAGYAVGGLYDPDVSDLDVARIHQGYLDGFRSRGGRLIGDAELLAVAGAPAQWEARTRAGTIHTPVIVDAAGAWADPVAILVRVRPLGLVFARRTAFVFEPSLDLAPDRPLVIDADETFSFKPEDGLVLAVAAEVTPTSPVDVGSAPADVARAIDGIERASRLRALRIMRRWTTLWTMAPDGTPVVGMDELLPGFFWLAGQGAFGIQTAPALARAAAGLLVDGVLPDDLLAAGIVAEDLMPARLRSAGDDVVAGANG